MNFNKAIILGNLTKDPDSRTLPSGQPVVNFSIATNRTFSDQSGNKKQAVEFHNIVVFGKLADICSRYLTKGKMVLIEGRIQTRSWQDQSGVKKYRTEIIAENMQMGPRGAGESSGNYPDSGNASSSKQSAAEDIPVIESDELPSMDEGEEKDKVNVKDIPF